MTSRKHKRPSALLVLVMTLTLALFAVACGGGDSEADVRVEAEEAQAEAEEAERAVADTQPDEVVSGPEADEVAEGDSDATPDEMEETDEPSEDPVVEADATQDEMMEADDSVEDPVAGDEAMVDPDTQDETEAQLSQANLDCQSAQDRVAEAYRDASVAHRAHADAYAAHIEAHDSEMNVQGSYDEVVEVAVTAEQADAAATRAQTLAIQACNETSSSGVYADQARCANSEQNLSVAERIYVDRLAALHDAHNQSAPEVEIVQAEVDSAWAKIELAGAEVKRDCPNSG